MKAARPFGDPRRWRIRGSHLSALFFLVAAVMSVPRVTLARERTAVLLGPVRESDRDLADNLTEVAISRLAEISDFELVGTRELRRRIAVIGSGDLPIDCLNDAACLGRVGIALGVRRLVSGTVRAEGSRFLIAMAIHDIESGKVERSFFRVVNDGLDSLIGAVQVGVSELFQPRPAPGQLRIDSLPDGAAVVVDGQARGTTPLWLNSIEPGKHIVRVEMSGRFPWKKDVEILSGTDRLITVSREDLQPRRTWALPLAYGSAAGALLAFAGAGLFGTLARVDPAGSSRGEAQADLRQRNTYAAITNVLLMVGGTLSGTSVFTFFRWRRDILGE